MKRCKRCGNLRKVRRGVACCEPCREDMKAYKHAQRLSLHAARLCQRCKRKREPGKTYCADCREHHRLRVAAARAAATGR